jgi:nuclear transport factor 2 (NTF2) superfamily protein
MKIRLIVAILGLAISFAVPAFAQQKDTAASQIDEQIVKKFDEAFNNGDAAAVAALYTEDAVQVTPQGPVFGREAIEKLLTGVFQQGLARALQQPSQQGRSGFSSHDRNGW